MARYLGFVNPAIQQIARGPQDHRAFRDITGGHSNTAEFPPTTIVGYRPGPGNRLGPAPTPRFSFPLLAHYASSLQAGR
jgi:hypothetical protein